MRAMSGATHYINYSSSMCNTCSSYWQCCYFISDDEILAEILILFHLFKEQLELFYEFDCGSHFIWLWDVHCMKDIGTIVHILFGVCLTMSKASGQEVCVTTRLDTSRSPVESMYTLCFVKCKNACNILCVSEFNWMSVWWWYEWCKLYTSFLVKHTAL